jgi:hypothetical protein
MNNSHNMQHKYLKTDNRIENRTMNLVLKQHLNPCNKTQDVNDKNKLLTKLQCKNSWTHAKRKGEGHAWPEIDPGRPRCLSDDSRREAKGRGENCKVN